MPLRPLLTRPGSGDKRRSSANITATQKSSETSIASNHKREDSWKRLSLGIIDPNDENYKSFFTQEPDEIESRRSSVQGPRSPESHLLPFPSVPEQPEIEEEQSKPESTPIPDEQVLVRPQRFSLLRFRNASDPQLSTRFKKSGTPISQKTHPPQMIVTSPTIHDLDTAPPQKKSKTKPVGRSSSPLRQSRLFRPSSSKLAVEEGNIGPVTSAPDLGVTKRSTEQSRIHSNSVPLAPPAYGDETSSSLAIPLSRLSESSRSDGSSGEHRVYAQTTTTHTILTTTTFFKLKRKKKDKGPLFPLPERFAAPASGRTSLSTAATPQDESPPRRSVSPERRSMTVRFDTASERHSAIPSPAHSTMALTNAPTGQPGPAIVRKLSSVSTHSGNSAPSVTLMPPRTSARGRSSTLGSFGKSAEKLVDTTSNATGSGRNSTSTAGRRSLGDLLALPHRKRQNSAPASRYGGLSNTPSIAGSKPNSLQLTREQEPELVFPEREEADTPATYVDKLEAAVPRSAMATILCKTGDDFSKTCLRKYMRGFSYFGDSIDIAMRKMLMEVELPKETQQIDRLLQGFADRYNECNPGIFLSPDEANFIAFSILLLHSDTHNKNNKRKMQKEDYVKNTQQGPFQVAGDVLECFYDNVCYTPFIHFDDEVAINSHRLSVPRPRKTLMRTKSSESIKGPVDPYVLILDNKLSDLRPPLKEVLETEDTYSCLGTATDMDVDFVHNAFANHAVLQIVSARSRPDAFKTQATITNPSEAQVGLVNIKIAKVGLLWRKDPKKKKTKRPWQEWGAILTDSKLYFFKDVNWVKKLMIQHDAHPKPTGKAESLVFKPPLTSFEPDAFISMDDTVALMDSTYKKHKNAFTFVKHGGIEEIFLANTEPEMNDWIHVLNYAATFRTAGIRLRGMLGTNYEGKRILRADSDAISPAPGDVATDIPSRGSIHSKDKIDPQVMWEILFYRRQLINEKISDFDEKIAAAQKELDHLLRNARHLLILLPIQAKSREALVFAAARMSAKLKWTRTELWRTKAHRDILVKDLEQESVDAFPGTATRGSMVSTPQKVTPLKTQPSIARLSSEPIALVHSPISVSSPQLRTPGQSGLDGVASPDDRSIAGSRTTTLDRNSMFSTSPFSDDASRPDSSHNLHALVHQASIVSSRSRSEHEALIAPLDPEDQVLKDAGLLGVEGATSKEKRPDTSGSDRERLNTVVSAPEANQSRVGSVKRTLQRSLREPTRDLSLIHRHKKGRESGSSLPTATEENVKINGIDKEELRRGTGSFILHGKKASVVTMSPEWQAMSSEDRLKLRKPLPSPNRASLMATTAAENEADASSRPTSYFENASTMGTPSRKPSTTTVTDGEFEKL